MYQIIKLVSIFAGNLGVEYSLNKWTHADERMIKKGYGLSCFDSLQAARLYRAHYGGTRSPNIEVYEAIVRQPLENMAEHRLNWEALEGCNGTSDFLNYRLDQLKSIIHYRPGIVQEEELLWPQGTVLVKSILLTKKIF